MKYIVLIILCSSAVIMSYSQTSASQTYDANEALQLYVGIGGGYNDYKNLNATLKDNNLPTVGKFTLANSLEADMRHKNLLMGLSGNMGFSNKKTDDYNSLLLTLGGQLSAAYYVLNNRNFHLAPQLGIGFFYSAVNLTQRNGFVDFNEVLENKNSISIDQAVPVLDFCIRFDVADFTKAKSGAGSIRLGYKYGLSNRGWGIDVSNNSTVNNSPEDRINQFYVMFSIGTSLLKPQQAK